MFHTRKGRVLAGLSSLALVAGLGACSAQPGVALQVGDTTYTEADITQSIDQFDEMFGQEPGRSEFVAALASAQYIQEMAKDHDIVVDDATVQSQLEAAKQQQSITALPDNLNHALVDLLRMQISVSDLQSKVSDTSQLTKELSEKQSTADVRLNPRYGQLDSANQIISSKFGDVVSAESAQSGADGSGSGNGSESGN